MSEFHRSCQGASARSLRDGRRLGRVPSALFVPHAGRGVAKTRVPGPTLTPPAMPTGFVTPHSDTSPEPARGEKVTDADPEPIRARGALTVSPGPGNQALSNRVDPCADGRYRDKAAFLLLNGSMIFPFDRVLAGARRVGRVVVVPRGGVTTVFVTRRS
jgi:hypothetical protein